MTSPEPDESEQRKAVEQHRRNSRKEHWTLADLVANDNYEAIELMKKCDLATEIELRLRERDEL